MGRRIGRNGGPAERQTVEVRLRFDAATAKRLDLAARIRDQTPSAFVAWALLPHLSFEVPRLPDVAVSALGAGENDAAPG